MPSHKVFISYSHEDRVWKERVLTHLEVLERAGLLDVWEDRQIDAGDDWSEEIQKAIKRSSVAILLVSADFLSSEFITKEEIPAILRHREQRGLRVFPVIIRACAWQSVGWLSRLQVRPEAGKALAAMEADAIDATLAEIATELNELLEELPAAPMPERPHFGKIVSKLCDRVEQMNDFDSFFRQHRAARPGSPQVFAVPGPEGEAHESLVERLVATRIAKFATEIGGSERGTVVNEKVPWPESGDIEQRKLDLTMALFRKCDETYMGHDTTAQALSGLSRFLLAPIVVIEHSLWAETAWDDTTSELLRWYLDEFWGTLTPSPDRPQLLVFIKVVYPTSAPKGFFRWLRKSASGDLNQLRQSLRFIAEHSDAQCPFMVFRELAPITAQHVRDWFNQNHIFEEQKRRRQADRILGETSAKCMAEIEAALARIHRQFVQESGGAL